VAALDYLEDAIEGRTRLTEAADVAHISPSRLTHLFSQEVGLPFRRFVLWLRLRRVVEEIGNQANLSQAAAAAGFSDAAHLSRVFRRAFGLTPSALLSMDVDLGDWPQ